MIIRNTAYLILLLAIPVYSAFGVQAEEDATNGIENRIERKTKETRAFVEEKKAAFKPLKNASGDARMKRDQMKKQAEELREEMEKKREEARNRFEKQREEFKEQLREIKDQKKKTIIENVDQRINEMNTKHTDTLENVLSKVTDILARLESKIASIEAEGVDTTEANKEIENANTLIQTASTAIATQAGKQYVIDVSATDEASLRVEVKKTFTTFKSDITAVHEKVKAARQAVVAVARLYGQLHNQKQVSVTPTVTTSP